MTACETCDGTRVVPCWSPGGPCPRPNDPACETCGSCNECTPTPPVHPTIRWDNWARPETPSWKWDDATTEDRYGPGDTRGGAR